MTNDEQIAICKAIAKSCMWGQSGIASVILDEFERKLPMQWRGVYDAHAREAKREAVGVVTDEAEVHRLLRRGYWLTNYQPGEMSIFNPPPMNGLYMYLSAELAERYGPNYDSHNYAVWQSRAASNSEGPR